MRGERFNRIVGYALARTEAYLIVGLVFAAVLVAIVGHWPGWIILASVGAGVLLFVLLILDSLSDPDAERDASIAEVEVGRLRDVALRAKVRRALDYVRATHKLARGDASGTLGAADEELPQLEAAVRSIYQVCLRLQEFRADGLLQRDAVELQRRAREGQLTDDQRAQLDTLQRLGALVQEAEREVDGAIAQLGRSYAEMQAIRVTPEFRGRAADALSQLEGSTKRLADLAKGYDEVFASRAAPGTT